MPVRKQQSKKTQCFGRKSKGRAQLAAARLQKSSTCASSSAECSSLEAPSPSAPVTPSSSTSPAISVTTTSASKRKLGYNIPQLQPTIPSTELPSTIINLNMLQPLFNNLLCPFCLQSSLSVCGDSNKNSGLAICVKVHCVVCGKDISSTFTSPKNNDDSRSYRINKMVVAAASATGMGYAGLCNFAEPLNIPSINVKTFNNYVKSIREQCVVFSKELLTKAVEKVKLLYAPEEDGIFNVHVSYDGSWHKRGHTSKTGLGCVIERKTGLVIDFEVLTLYCARCATTGEKIKRESNVMKYERWYEAHKPFCDVNFTGTSGGMEKDAAVTMWQRSIQKHRLRYVSMISDGDSKTISEIHKADPYPGIEVEKHECLNHVGKRMGTQLRNVVKLKSKEKPKVTLGGKGYGKLRPDVISRLQKYYSNAIRNNSSVPAMQRAIMATLHHCNSTDDAPQHDLCPSGENSWCFFQRAVSQGIPLESLEHEKLLRTPLCELAFNHIKPLYVTMCDEKLLRRCMLQSTQNANESVHSVIWARCPKHQFATKARVEIAVAVGVGEFNFGSTATQDFMRALDIPVGHETRKRGQKRDWVRIYKAESANSEKAKRWREAKAEAKNKEEERLKELFGEFYFPGGGD